MTLIELLPQLYETFDKEKGGLVLKSLLEACDQSFQETQREISLFPDLMDIDNVEDRFLPYLLRNLANPFKTTLLEKSSKAGQRWVMGETSFGVITEDRWITPLLTVDLMRDLARQLFQIYKRKGTKLGMIMACRAVAACEVFIADHWTDSAAQLRHSDEEHWILGETSFGVITEDRIIHEPPYCEVTEGFVGIPPYSNAYDTPEESTNECQATLDFVEVFDVYERFVIFEINLSLNFNLPGAKLLFQATETGGFTWRQAKGWLTSTPVHPNDFWVLGESSLGEDTWMIDAAPTEGMTSCLGAGAHYFIFDVGASGFSPDSTTGYLKFRVLPFKDVILGIGDTSRPFRARNGLEAREERIEPEYIPAHLVDNPGALRAWVLGETSFGTLYDSGLIESRRGLYHFEVIILNEASSDQIEMVREVVEYMKPAHTHFDLIPQGQIQTPNLHWILDQTSFGVIVEPQPCQGG